MGKPPQAGGSAAYRGRPRLPASAPAGPAVLLGLLVVVASRSDSPWWAWPAVLASGAVNHRQVLLALSLPRPKRSPFVVDAPGVRVRDAGVGEHEPRLVHWETIAEIVLFRATAPRRRGAQRRASRRPPARPLGGAWTAPRWRRPCRPSRRRFRSWTGPPLRRPRPYGVEAVALVAWQRLRSRP